MSEGGAPQESARAKRARIKAAAEARAAGEDRAAGGESAPVPDAPVDAPVGPTPTTAPLLIVGNTWFQLESLYTFSAKFQPVWYPRFLIYPRVGHFVRGSIAAGQAESFIVFPRLTLPSGRRR